MLEVCQLTYQRDDRILFQNLSFEVHPTHWIHIKGANGAGKTTLLKTVAGLLSGYEGRVLWSGSAISHSFDYAQQRLFLGHQLGISPQLTPLENLRYFVALESTVDEVLLTQAIDEVGLMSVAHLPCQFLSEGQKKRVALARLILSTASLWILDEPFSAMDQVGVQWLHDLLQRHVASGGMIMMTTHQEMTMSSAVNIFEIHVELT